MRRFLAMAALLTVMASGSAQAGFPVPDGSFEQEKVGTNNFQYNPTGGPWTFSGNSGVINGTSAFGNPPAEDGAQLAFLQTNPKQGQGQPGVISQTFTLSQGVYSVSVFEANRSGYPNSSYTIQENGVKIGGDTVSSTSFVNYNSSFFTFAGGSLTLTFTSTGPATMDTTTFLDNVTLTSAAAVPEPASFAMLGFGLLASGGFYARKARRNRN